MRSGFLSPAGVCVAHNTDAECDLWGGLRAGLSVCRPAVDACRVRPGAYGYVTTGVVVRKLASGMGSGLAHEVSCDRGARLSMMRIGAPQIGHGASGRCR